MSPELQARLQGVELTWAAGLKTHALQQGTFRGGPADKFAQWHQPDPGPGEGEQRFSDEDFLILFSETAAVCRGTAKRKC